MGNPKGKQGSDFPFRDEPIAVIGIGCAFPGGINTPSDFWELLVSGKSVLGPIPDTRARILLEKNHRLPVSQGGFFGEIDLFDPEFLGIPEEEAFLIDPQHRLLLEVGWKTAENAGYCLEDLRRDKTGVFVSSASHEYQNLLLLRHKASLRDIHRGSGNVAADRLTRIFGLHGPSVAIDTTCSSSLAAVHYAANSLRLRECSFAFAGGASLILSSEPELISQSDHLSPDGRCLAFDSRANGLVLGEGCGMVLLKRLDDAIRDGDTVLGTILSSVVSDIDPNRSSDQEGLLRETLERVHINPEDVSYIEANGTGDPEEDMVELNAIKSAYRPKENGSPLHIGSVKTNIGHLGSASGIAGFIKTILALNYETISPHPSFECPLKGFDWGKKNVHINGQRVFWSRCKKTRIAGVSSFGICGSSVHLLVQEGNVPMPSEKAHRKEQLLLLSARNETLLHELAQQFCDFLVNQRENNLADVCLTAQVGREHLEERLAIIGSSTDEIYEGIKSYLHGLSSRDDLFGRVAKNGKPVIAFLFPGTGFPVQGIGRELYEDEPLFRSILDTCDEILKPLLNKSLLTVLFEEGRNDLHRADCFLPALFSFEYALARLWESWGVKPDCLLGHGFGEFVAGAVANVFPLEEGLRFSAELGKHLDLHGFKKETLGESSTLPDSMVSKVSELLSPITFSPPVIPLMSGANARTALEGEVTDPEHWVRCLTSPMPFQETLEFARNAGASVFLEVGTAPCFEDLIHANHNQPESIRWLSSLQGDRNCVRDLMETLGSLYVKGVDIDWKGFARGFGGRRIQLPVTDPFLGKRYWVEREEPGKEGKKQTEGKALSQSPLDASHRHYVLKWKEAPLAQSDMTLRKQQGTTLILKDVKGKGKSLALLLREAGQRTVTVRKGETFVKIGEDEYETGEGEEAILALLDEMKGQNVTRIVHMQTILNRTEMRRVGDLDELLQLGLYSLHALVRGLARENRTEPIEIVLVAEYVNEVTGTEVKLVPEYAPFLALGKVIPKEHPNISCRSIDVDHFLKPETLLQELSAANAPYLVAYRDEVRYIEELQPLWIPVIPQSPLRLKQRGVYVITGGAGEIGLRIADLLASCGAGNIALINRTLFPSREHWEGIVKEGGRFYRRILDLQRITSSGTNISFYSADISDNDSLEEIFVELRRDHEHINGIFHCAGIDASEEIRNETTEELRSKLLPKVYGTWLLNALTNDDVLDFCVLFSSASTLFPKAGRGGNIAGNSYLDIYPAFMRKLGKRVQAINWARWSETESFQGDGESELFLPLGTEEALASLTNILECGERNVVVGKLNFPVARKGGLSFALDATILGALENSSNI